MIALISCGELNEGRRYMEPKTLSLIGGLFLVFVGALLIILQAAIAQRYGMEKSVKRTVMPGLSLVFIGVVLLLLA
jgi:hypothetical protein